MMHQLLEKISSPKDLKGLSSGELTALAEQIRERIIQVMANNGGHLASSLGAVELTLAIHKNFNTPADKVVWDVGHQTYAHKIITGRNNHFDTIRQTHGLCGFTHPGESPHDHFFAGHAGTALSEALGLAKQRDLVGGEEYIIAVIGDGTLTCGMSLEALNNMSRDLKRFVVILNDNKMSISKNVGQIANVLSRMLSNPITTRLHQEFDTLLSKIPGYGSAITKQGHKVTESIKNLFSPAAFFENFGLTYIGPIDGHDTKHLSDIMNKVKDSNWPVIIHCLTNKGQGLEAAQKNPTAWHGAAPFDMNTHKFLQSSSLKKGFPKVFGEHLLAMAQVDEKVVAVTPAMATGSCLDMLMAQLPQRCFDVGIAESHAITFAGALAYKKKLKVFASIYSTFLQRAFDNVFHDICLQDLPVVLAIDRAGLSGPDGATHHGIYDIAWLNAMPNMVICQPRNGQLLKELMASAHSWEQPTAIRYPNLKTDEGKSPLVRRKPGEGEILAEGKGLLIVGLGVMCETALEVCEILKESDIDATVVDPIFVKPLDTELLCSLLTTHNKIVTIEEHSVVSGLGSIINNFLMSHGYSDIQVLNCGIPETFVESGNRDDLLEELHLTPKLIVRRIKNAFMHEEATASLH